MNMIHPPLAADIEHPPVSTGLAGFPSAAEAVLAPLPVARRRRRWRSWAAVGVVLALAGIWWAWTLRESAPPVAMKIGAPKLPPGEFRLSETDIKALRIEPVALADFRAERIAEGRIALNDDRSTPVFAPFTGRVLRVTARLGDEVAEGDVLFEIEATDLAAAASDLLTAVDAANKARVATDQSRREERRQNDLFAARAASQRDVEQARAAASTAAADQRTAEATLAAARDKLRVLGRSAEQVRKLEATRQSDAVAAVLAPIAGTVVQRRVGPGQWIAAGAGDPQLTISDRSTVWLVAAVREIDAPLMQVGQPVEVTVGALPDRRFAARVTTVAAGLDPATRRLTVRAEVEDPQRLLKPEMFATFRIAIGDDARRVAVPAGAVIHRGAAASVWVSLGDGRFALRPVQLGFAGGDRFAVLEGLQPGERIVTAGTLFIDRAARTD
jgi:membrane fusion protein, heavy metal efflux system